MLACQIHYNAISKVNNHRYTEIKKNCRREIDSVDGIVDKKDRVLEREKEGKDVHRWK